MSNYIGTIFGVIGIFLSLVMFWFLISFGFVLIASLIDCLFAILTVSKIVKYLCSKFLYC